MNPTVSATCNSMLMGAGAPNSLYGGDLVWTGSLKLPGTYYVVVMQNGRTPSTINLQVIQGGS